MKASDQSSNPSHFIVGYCIMLMQTWNPDVTPINTELGIHVKMNYCIVLMLSWGPC